MSSSCTELACLCPACADPQPPAARSALRAVTSTMTSAANPPYPPHVHPPTTSNHATTTQPPTPTSHASPPSKRDLKSWWKNFKLSSRHEESHGEDPSAPCDTFPKGESLFAARYNADCKSYISTFQDGLQPPRQFPSALALAVAPSQTSSQLQPVWSGWSPQRWKLRCRILHPCR